MYFTLILLIATVANFIFSWVAGVWRPLVAGDLKPLKVRIFAAGNCFILALFLLDGLIANVPKGDKPADEQQEKVRKAIERVNENIREFNKKIEEAAQAVPRMDDTDIEKYARNQVVPTGNYSLCYVAGRDEKHPSILLVSKVFSLKQIPKTLEQRDGEEVTVWSRLDQQYATSFLRLFEKMKVKSWVEPSKPATTPAQPTENLPTKSSTE